MPTSNKLLSGLAAGDLAQLRPNLKQVDMTRGTLLHPVGSPIAHVYFPASGMVSMLSVTKSGEQIETAIIGMKALWAVGSPSTGPTSTRNRRCRLRVLLGKFRRPNFSKSTGQAILSDRHVSGRHSISGPTERGMPRTSFGRGAPLPLAPPGRGPYGLQPNPVDARISVSHARSTAEFGVTVRACFAEVGFDRVPARENKNY